MSRRRRGIALLAAAIACADAANPARAITWNSATSGNFNTSSNWTGSVVPGGGDSAQFNVGGSYNVTLDINPSTASLSVGGSNVTLLNSTPSRTWTIGGAMSITAGGLTLNASQPIALTTGVASINTVDALLSINAGSSLSMRGMNIGIGAPASNVTVDGTGSSISATATTTVGQSAVGSLTIQNGATAPLSGLAVAGGASGTLTVQSGAGLTTSGAISIATGGTPGANGTMTVTGSGSSAVQSGSSTLTVGAASGGTGTLNVNSTGVVTTGTGGTTINATGLINIAGGTFNANGDITVTGGNLTQSTTSGSTFNWAGAHTMTLQSSGKATVVGEYFTPSNAVINVTGGASQFNANLGTGFNGLYIVNNAQANVMSSAGMVSQSYLIVGSGFGSTGTLTVDGLGSFVSVASGEFIGLSQGTGTVTVRNSGNAIFSGNLTLGNDDVSLNAGNGTLNVQSGGSVSAVTMRVGTAASSASMGAVNLTGGSITQGGSSTLNVGAASLSSGTVTISGGAFSTGTGTMTINKTGTINLSGGILNANGDIFVAGGTLSRTSGNFNWASSKGLAISNGGTFSYSGGGDYTFPSSANVNIQGTSSQFNFSGGGSDFLNVNNNAFVGVFAGSGLNASGLAVGTSGFGSVSVQNSGSRATVSGDTRIGWNGATGSMTFSAGTTGSLGAVNIATTPVVGSIGTLTVQGGAVVTTGSLAIGTGTASGVSGTIDLDGPGSRVSQSNGSSFTLGASASGSGRLNVNNGAVFIQGSSSLNTYITAQVGSGMATLNTTGVINISGGSVSLGTLNSGVNVANLTFNYGALGFGGDLDVKSTGLLGATVVLNPDRSLAMSGTCIIFGSGSLTLNGGELSAFRISNAGTFTFNSGTLAINGESMMMGADVLGTNLTLPAGKNLAVALTTTLPFGTSIALTGGKLTTGQLAVSGGTFTFDSGTLWLTNQAFNIDSGGLLGASLNLGSTRTMKVTSTTTIGSAGLLTMNGGTFNGIGGITNNGEIRIVDSLSTLQGGTITNNKLIDGDGVIGNSLTNAAAGEVRASNTQHLKFTGTTNSSAGKINVLSGGSIEFTQPLANSGTIQISGGSSDFLGVLTNTSAGKVIVTGNSTATFLNDITNIAGSEFRVGTGSTAVFFGPVTGSSAFTGSGMKIFESTVASSVLGIASITGDTVVDGSTVVSAGVVREDSLEVDGRLNIPQDGTSAATSRVNELLIPGGKLDLTNNKLIVTANPGVGQWTGSTYTGVLALVKSGRNGGTWDGSGIITSMTAAASPTLLTTLAVATAADVGKTTFGGLTVAPTDVLVMYTWSGDANLSGAVDADDYWQIDSHYGKSGNAAKSFFSGDFNLDGIINGDDYVLIDASFAGQGPPIAASSGVTSIPEPAVFVLGAALLLPRRRR